MLNINLFLFHMNVLGKFWPGKILKNYVLNVLIRLSRAPT